MSYTDSAQVDTEARRYLKHHHLLDAARQRAYHYLNQTWLYMTRSLNRELRAQGQLMKSTWVELMSTQAGEYIGVNWYSISSQGVYTITMADVRYDPDLNGEHVVFKISADRIAARQHLQQSLSAEKVLALYPSDLDLAAHLLQHNLESECVLSLCFPLRLDQVKREAKTLIAWAAPLWGLIESGAHDDVVVANSIPNTTQNNEKRSHHRSPEHAHSSSSESMHGEPASEVSRSRYPSAAPPLDHHAAQDYATPNTHSTSHSHPTISGHTYALDEESNLSYSNPLAHDGDMDDYAQKRTRMPKRSARLVRGGEPNRPVDQNSTTRFVPRSLPRETSSRSHTNTSKRNTIHDQTSTTQSSDAQTSDTQVHDIKMSDTNMNHASNPHSNDHQTDEAFIYKSAELSSDAIHNMVAHEVNTDTQVMISPDALSPSSTPQKSSVHNEIPQVSAPTSSIIQTTAEDTTTIISSQDDLNKIITDQAQHLQAHNPQAQNLQTQNPQTQNFQTQNPQTQNLQTQNPQAQNPQAQNLQTQNSQIAQQRLAKIEQQKQAEHSDVSKPTYIKNIQQALQEDMQSPGSQAHMNPPATDPSTAHHNPSARLDLEALIAALGKCGLSPWRINTYAQNQGRILWLQNGAHIDLNPQGDVILGGENQEETRHLLNQLGIPI